MDTCAWEQVFGGSVDGSRCVGSGWWRAVEPARGELMTWSTPVVPGLPNAAKHHYGGLPVPPEHARPTEPSDARRILQGSVDSDHGAELEDAKGSLRDAGLPQRSGKVRRESVKFSDVDHIHVVTRTPVQGQNSDGVDGHGIGSSWSPPAATGAQLQPLDLDHMDLTALLAGAASQRPGVNVGPPGAVQFDGGGGAGGPQGCEEEVSGVLGGTARAHPARLPSPVLAQFEQGSVSVGRGLVQYSSSSPGHWNN